MKTSNKIILIASGCMVALIIALIVIFRVTTTGLIFSGQNPGKTIETTGDKIKQSYAITDFTKLSIPGSWNVKVNRADSYQVSVTAPKKVLDVLKIYKAGDTLHMELENGIRFTSGYTAIDAEISLPAVTSLDVSGASRLDLNGFTADKLDLTISGASRLTGSDNRITQLDIDCSGAADIDLSRSTITNADLNVSGAAKIDLTMAGGTLKGQLSGVASVTYHGQVQSQELQTSGLAKINRAD